MQAKDMKELFSLATSCFKRIFKVTRVNFLLQCKDTIDLVREEGIQVKQMTNAYQTFYVIVPEGIKKEDFEITFYFKNMSDVNKRKVFTGRNCVAPTNRLGYPDLPLCLI